MARIYWCWNVVILCKEDVELFKKAELPIHKVPYSMLAKLGIPQMIGARPGDVLLVEIWKGDKIEKCYLVEVTGQRLRRLPKYVHPWLLDVIRRRF